MSTHHSRKTFIAKLLGGLAALGLVARATAATAPTTAAVTPESAADTAAAPAPLPVAVRTDARAVARADA